MGITQEVRESRQLSYIALVLGGLAVVILGLMFFGVRPTEILAPFVILKTTNLEASNVTLTPEIESILRTRYESDIDEFVYCMYGDFKDGSFYVQRIESTKVHNADEMSLEYERCPYAYNFLGTIHSHPQPKDPRYQATCALSKQDVYTFGQDGTLLSGVICGAKEYGFYSRADVTQPLNVLIFMVNSK